MAAPARTPARRFFIPEIIQTSEMDCGPAALASLLAGFDIRASYARLREACQTSVDGTSIDTLEEVSVQLGLDAEQILLPADHVFLNETRALPAILVVRLPTGLTHFLVAWNRFNNWIQVMDPGVGRRWIQEQELVGDLFIHTERVTFAEWREWVGAAGFLNPLRRRMNLLRVSPDLIEKWIADARADPGWYSSALLDAAVRMTTALVRAGALRIGPEARETIRQIVDAPPERRGQFVIPPGFWSAVPDPNGDQETPTHMMATGAVIVRVLRKRATNEPLPEDVEPPPPEVIAALTEPPSQPLVQVLDALRADGFLTPTVLCIAIAMAGLGVFVQALIFQALLRISALTTVASEQLQVLVVVIAFLFALFAVELPISQIVPRIGRRLETRLRIRFLEKLPRLADSYFSSRLPSDMVSRAHSLHQLHALPEIGVNLLRTFFQLLFTLAGIVWLEPSGAWLAIGATAVFLAVAYLTRPILQERDLRVRSHVGGLSRYSLDSLRGLIPLKMHGAERAFRRDYEGLLVEWARASQDLARTATSWQGISALIYSLFAIWMVSDAIAHQGANPGALLLFFWVLSLPLLATSFVQIAQQYPTLRNFVLRILEPLGAPDETSDLTGFSDGNTSAKPVRSEVSQSVAIEFENVSVEAGGHTILHNIQLRVRAGEHVAIVGPSGAGKSSLAGVLLGWRKPFEGECRIDGELNHGARLVQLRRETVWVDPDVWLWNQSLWDNLLYGNTPRAQATPERAITAADLLGVVEQLDSGVETLLGQGGGLVSGGEGQRVRLGRGMTRNQVRLIILDEPFRGLDRETRRKLLARSREYWQDETLLCITHDVSETLAFERVLVIEEGKIVEDGAPSELAANVDSRYRAMLESEEQVRQGLWQGADWRRWEIRDGVLRETKQEEALVETTAAQPVERKRRAAKSAKAAPIRQKRKREK